MNPFEYKRAGSVAQAVRENAKEGAKLLAGGTNLIDLMKYDVERHAELVDITRLDLKSIGAMPKTASAIEGGADGGLLVGALVNNTDLAADPRIMREFGVLSKALLSGASPQLRNLATTGGNLLQRTRCYYFYDTALPCNKREPGSGCPAIEGYNRIHAILGQSDQCIAVHPSDMAVAMRALDAVVMVQSPNGSRSIPIADFHRLPGDTPQIDTNLAKDELILGVALPAAAKHAKSAYVKARDRASYAFALVSCAAFTDAAGNVRLALGGVAHKPWRCEKAEAVLMGKPMNAENFRAAAEAELADAKGYEHNAFKIELAKRTIVRALTEIA